MSMRFRFLRILPLPYLRGTFVWNKVHLPSRSALSQSEILGKWPFGESRGRRRRLSGQTASLMLFRRILPDLCPALKFLTPELTRRFIGSYGSALGSDYRI